MTAIEAIGLFVLGAVVGAAITICVFYWAFGAGKDEEE